jgi:protein SCO1/2
MTGAYHPGVVAGEPTLKAAVLRGVVVLAAFVGGVFFFASPPPPPSSPLASPAATQAVLSTDCDVGARACRFSFDAHHAITLELGPRPVQPAAPLVVEARFDGAATNPRVTIAGTAMSMPVTTLSLAPRGQGAFVGRGALPVCTEAMMTWTARVDVELDDEPHAATFAFVTRRAPGGADSASTAATATGAASAVAADDAGGADAEVVLLPPGDPVEATLLSGERTMTLSSLRGQVVLVAFGFTSCPDVCPTTLSSWASALRALTPQERAAVRGLFISVDPDRDPPAHVAQYATYFDAALIGATGTRAQIDAIARRFSAYYAIHATPDVDAGADYAVDHAVFTWVVDGTGRIVARLPLAASVDVTVSALRRFLPSRSP